jgi:hypothetical protein
VPCVFKSRATPLCVYKVLKVAAAVKCLKRLLEINCTFETLTRDQTKRKRELDEQRLGESNIEILPLRGELIGRRSPHRTSNGCLRRREKS